MYDVLFATIWPAMFGDFLAFFGIFGHVRRTLRQAPANFGGRLRRPGGGLGSATGNSPAPGAK